MRGFKVRDFSFGCAEGEKVKIAWFNWEKNKIIPNYKNAEFVLVEGPHTQKTIQNVYVWDSQIIIIDYQNPFLPEHLKNFKNLKAIVTQTSRTDHVKLPDSKIEILSIGGKYCAQTIAEKCLTNSNYFDKESKIKNVGIIGFGMVGQKIAELFSDRTIFYSDIIDHLETICTRLTLKEIFNFCDLIILTVPITRRSENLISKQTQFGRKPIIFNLSGPEVVSEKVLSFLQIKNMIGPFWFDFHEGRSIFRPEMILTPHTAWRGERSIENRFNDTLRLLEKNFNLEVMRDERQKMRGLRETEQIRPLL